jgi:gas vesicle protein
MNETDHKVFFGATHSTATAGAASSPMSVRDFAEDWYNDGSNGDGFMSGALNNDGLDNDRDAPFEEVISQAVYRLIVQQKESDKSHEQLAWIVLQQHEEHQASIREWKKECEAEQRRGQDHHEQQLQDLREVNQSLIQKCSELIRINGELLRKIDEVAKSHPQHTKYSSGTHRMRSCQRGCTKGLMLLMFFIAIIMAACLYSEVMAERLGRGKGLCLIEEKDWYELTAPIEQVTAHWYTWAIEMCAESRSYLQQALVRLEDRLKSAVLEDIQV